MIIYHSEVHVSNQRRTRKPKTAADVRYILSTVYRTALRVDCLQNFTSGRLHLLHNNKIPLTPKSMPPTSDRMVDLGNRT